jgi:hypothetical protein
MRKLTKVLALLAVATVLFSACRQAHSCPAYGKLVKPAVDKQG